MISYHKIARLVFGVYAVLLLSLPGLAQYTATYSLTGVDVLNSTYSPYSGWNCVSDNCWVNFTGNAVNIAAAADGTVYHVDSSHEVWLWNWSTQAWNRKTNLELSGSNGHTVTIYAGSATEVMILGSTATHNVFTLQSDGTLKQMANGACIQGGIDAAGNLWCLGTSNGNGNIYEWVAGGTSWQQIDGAFDNIAVSSDGNVMGVNGANATWVWETTLGWQNVSSSVPFTPSTNAGAIAIGNDSVMMLDTSGNVWISHDNGSTFSEVSTTYFTPTYLTVGGAGLSLAVASNTYLYHLNTVLAQGAIHISGTCGSACGSGDPNVTVNFYDLNHANAKYVCPSGWEPLGDPECYLSTTADAVLDATPFSAGTTCDGFAPGPSCSSTNFKLEVVLAVGGIVFTSSNDCDCNRHETEVNQKYYIKNNFNVEPSGYGLFGVGALIGNYEWTGVGMQQWCTSTFFPLLDLYGGNVHVVYKGISPKPTKMPGRYVNGDVEGIVTSDGLGWGVALTVGAPHIRVYGAGGIPGHIYTWNNDSQQRGPGGDPVTPCQGGQL